MRLIIAFLFISTFSFGQTYVIKSVEDVKDYNGGAWISVGNGDPFEELEFYDQVVKLIDEKFTDVKVVSKTSEKIYDSLGKPNAKSTLKNKYNISDWKNFITEYKTNTKIEGKIESQIIDELLIWRKSN